MKNNISDELIATVLNLIKNKKYDEALNQLNGLLEKKQNSNFINKMKGLIYLHKKEWVKSLHHYQKISKTEINFEISNNMGVSFYKIGKYYEASTKFSQSIKNNNTFIPAYENFCLTNKLLGNYDLAIKLSLKALELHPSNIKIKNNLIDIFNYFKPKNNKNSIIKINNKIIKLSLKKNRIELIKNSEINKILNKSQQILNDNQLSFNYPHTQIFKKNITNYECERHLKIFDKHKIIPQFCFNCYKVQITLRNVLNLLKVYFYFNNLNLKNNNIRKCIIELRNNIDGNYKGYIFCSSVFEAENIKKMINNDLKNGKVNFVKIEIKHGCTEYYEEFELYKNINENVKDKIYKDEWADIEKKFDEKNFLIENKKQRIFNASLKIFNLPDFLIIKNWLIYAKITGDNSYKKVIKFDPSINHLTQYEMQKIRERKKYLLN